MKKLFTFFLVITSILYIYIFTYDKKIYYFSISNNLNNKNEDKIASFLKEKKILEKYVNNFNSSSNRIIDFTYMIENNTIVKIDNKKVSFKNALVKADIITIVLVPENTNFSDTYKTINYRNDLISFLNKIREYSKEDIFYVGLNEESENEIIRSNIKKINNEIKEFCQIQKIHYIDYTVDYYSSIIEQVKTNTLN